MGIMQRNFVLLDVMKTGDYFQVKDFVKEQTIANQQFDCADDYFTLHNYDLTKYDRRFAMIHVGVDNRKYDCQEFLDTLKNRMAKLKENNFVFIYASPWESYNNLTTADELFFPKKTLPGYVWCGGVSWFWFYMQKKHSALINKIKHNNKSYDFLYLNKTYRPHRYWLYEALKKTDLLKNSLVTFVKHPTDPCELPKAYELPWLDINQPYPLYGMDQDVYEKPYEHTVASIVSETNDNDNDVFITEKLWKVILMKHLFVVHGNYQYLKKIQHMGFKTFANILDESYDNERNRYKKIDKIIDTIKQIKKYNSEDLYNKTLSIREHNFKHFYNKNALSKVINDEILLWLKFFDSSQISSAKS